MKYILAYQLASHYEPIVSKKSIINIFNSINASYTDDELDNAFNKLSSNDLKTLIEEGMKKMNLNAKSSSAPVAAVSAQENIQEKVEDEDDESDVDLFDGFD